MANILDFFKGNFSKKTLTHYLFPGGVSLFAFFIVLARLLFPYVPSYPYNWTTSMISRLGWPEVNTMGWIFFSIAFFLLGVLSVPLIPYIYRRLSEFSNVRAKIIVVLMAGVAVSLLLLGAIPSFNTADKIFMTIHQINAGMLVGGGIIMIAMSLILILRVHFKKGTNQSNFSGKLITLYIIVGIYAFLCITMIGISMSLVENLGGRYIHDFSTPLLLSGPFWEWQILLTLITMIALPCYILPGEVE